MFPANMSAVFDAALRRNRGRVAIEEDHRSITYDQLDRWSAKIAATLSGRGVKPGQAVALYTNNCAEFLACDVAIARLGAARVPVNHLLPGPAVAHMLRTADAAAMVVTGHLAANAQAALEILGQDLVVYQVDDGTTPLIPGAEWLEGIPDESALWPVADLASDAPAALLFTGGTTGGPKGVLLSQRAWVSFHTAQLIEAEIREQDRLLLMTPLAHAAGVFAQTALVRGATVVLHDGFDAARALSALRDQRITWTFLVPTMIYRLLDAAATDRRGFDDLATIVYGAAPITPARLGQALDLFGPVFVQLYGQTENPNWGTRLTKSDHDVDHPELLASCGRASIACEVKIVDDEGHDLPTGEAGEVCLRSPYTLSCYVGNEEATREKFLGDWIRTGDVGVLDEAGYLYLKDRRGDMVISGGMNVYCREVEDTLGQHPAVRSAAVIGVPDEDWGEAVHAVVVADDGLTEDALLEWARTRLAGYARPKRIEFVATLPETPFGKIDKKQLRAKYWGGRERAIG